MKKIIVLGAGMVGSTITIDLAKKMKKEKEISEDDLFTLQDSAQKETDVFIKQIDDSLEEKEKEVMVV